MGTSSPTASPLTAPTPPASTALRIPITNGRAGGDYTAQIMLGSGRTPANVILDTGSSTLAVVPAVYDPGSDTTMQTTSLAQDIVYGTGAWTGPVVQTQVAMGPTGSEVTVDAYVALTTDNAPGDFNQADGILGLAFNALNAAANVASYLTDEGAKADETYPWPFNVGSSGPAIQQFQTFLSRMPQEDLPPYFTALEAEDVTRNLFAFYTLRSMPSATDPSLNDGVFVLGGGPEQTDLYTGAFVDVKVVDDMWYNTNLLSVRVGQGDTVTVPQLSARYGKTMISNSIVDSGTNGLALSARVYDAIIRGFTALGGSFAQTIERAMSQPDCPRVASDTLDLAQWPEITFTLEGATGEGVPLTCSASTYWQQDAPEAGVTAWTLSRLPVPQSILGLPLMNNYYTVFDRTQDAYGVIRFAPIAPPTS